MKYLLTFALMGLFGIASIGYSQEIPKGLKEYIHQLQNDRMLTVNGVFHPHSA